MFKKIISSAKESGYQKLRRRGVNCPSCGRALPLPEHLPEAGFSMTVKCDHCSWVGGLSNLMGVGSGKDTQSPLLEKPEKSKIKEAIGEVKASWLIPAKKGVNFLMFFAAFWLLITGGVTFGLTFGTVEASGDMPLWGGLLFLSVFWMIGLGVGYAGLRMAYTEFLIRVDEEKVILTRKFFKKISESSIPREHVVGVSLSEAYRQNERPVYQLEIERQEGKNLKFGSHLSHDEKRWLLAGLKSVLGGEALLGNDGEGVLGSGGGGLEELKTKSFSIQAIGHFGVRMIRNYTAGPVLITIGLISIIGDLCWMGYMWQVKQGCASSDGVARGVDFIFSSVELIFSLIGLLIGIGLFLGGRWALGRKKIFEFGRDALEVTTEWRGTQKKKRFSKESVLRVDKSHSGNVNNEARFSVSVLTGSEKVTVCGFEPRDVADTATRWIEEWIAK